MERKGRDQQQPPKRCPRCESTNTKFCYYNNYSQSQPRHYCKACRRYWTEGGTLRNVSQSGGSAGGRRGSKRQKKAAGSLTPTAAACAAVAPMSTGPANRSATTTLSAGPEEAFPLFPPPRAPFFFMGEGVGEGLMGLQGGNECRRFIAELGEQSAMMPLLLSSPPPGFINFPVPQHQQLQPQNLPPPNMMIHPTPPMPSVAAFTAAAAAGPSASGAAAAAAAGYDGEEGFWNVFGNGVPPTSSGPF